MTLKIPGALKKIYTNFRWDYLIRRWQSQKVKPPEKSDTPEKPSEIPATHDIYPAYYDIKLATVHITPKLKLLSFRVSKNYLYLSLARPNTDLAEFNGLVAEET